MEKLICFQIENTREIERLASNMKIRVIKADASMYNEVLDSIVNGKISSVNSTSYASISPAVTDRALTLSTCSYEFDNARFVLHAILYEL